MGNLYFVLLHFIGDLFHSYTWLYEIFKLFLGNSGKYYLMNHFKFYLFFILMLAICLPHKAFSLNPKSNKKTEFVSDDNLLKVKTAILYGTKVLQISFDGQADQFGFMQIKNSSNEVVLQKKEVELISSPYYDSIDISSYKADTYTVTLIVNGKTYNASIDIK